MRSITIGYVIPHTLYLIPNTTKSMPKRTYQPKVRRRARRHGFLKRMSTASGKAVVAKRRRKGRASLSTSGR